VKTIVIKLLGEYGTMQFKCLNRLSVNDN